MEKFICVGGGHRLKVGLSKFCDNRKQKKITKVHAPVVIDTTPVRKMNLGWKGNSRPTIGHIGLAAELLGSF